MAAIEWHEGEIAVHHRLNGPHYSVQNPTAPGLPQANAYRVAASPLVAFGALDKHGRPWTTVLGGEAQFAQQVAPNVLGVQSLVDIEYDPVVDALFGSSNYTGSVVERKGDGGLLRYEAGNGPVMAGLSIDLETRDRVKLAGRMLVGAVSEWEPVPSDASGRIGELQLAFIIQEALGNCPKYLNRKRIRPHVPQPRLIYDSDIHGGQLPQEGIDVVKQADSFFLSSTDGKTMDTNHRGGPPGFVRIAENRESGDETAGGRGGENAPPGTGIALVYPEYSGNRLHQTLGNLHVKPLVGMVVPDFETGNILYLTGHTKTLVGPDAAAYLPHTKLALHITVDRAVVVSDGLSFRGEILDYSPYNPPVRPLCSETTEADDDIKALAEKIPIATALLVSRHELSPIVSRFAFTLDPLRGGDVPSIHWQAGQYITLDFGPELDVGWSHMREDDPQSLNDDFIRTFTISSPPPSSSELQSPSRPVRIELTLRRHGPATNLLWRNPLRVPLELPVLAFGGSETFRIPASLSEDGNVPSEEAVFIAAGVGITPLLAQAPGLLAAAASFRVLWSLKAADIPVAADSFARIPGLAEHATVFITGGVDATADGISKIQHMGAAVVKGRRVHRDDIVSSGEKTKGAVERKIYLCTGPVMLQELQAWLPDENLVWESFAF